MPLMRPSSTRLTNSSTMALITPALGRAWSGWHTLRSRPDRLGVSPDRASPVGGDDAVGEAVAG
ncbi:MAG: hypothetical protein MZV64_59430 [Ignavibacteriales bacterium]|nr:hypothetical protein [Ignavibacteriales bacterium]